MQSLSYSLSVTRAQIAQSQRLREQLQPILAHSSALIARARSLCRGFRLIAGSSDLDMPLIIETIRKTPMCVECLVRRTGVPPGEITQAFQRIGEHLAVASLMASCGSCLRLTRLYGLTDGANGGAPASSAVPRRAVRTQNEAIWEFLESHRGKMFCTQCVATALSASRRIDRAVLGAEGRGALRRYGVCARCGKDRLLCGLAN